MNHDVFISYSSENKQTAIAICHVLEQRNIKCWIAPRDIPPGSDYGDVIDKAIVACRVFVIIFSKPASASQWVRGELNLAFTEGKHIVPYRIDKTALSGSMRVMLNQTHWIDAYPDAESKFNELTDGIARYLNIPVNPPLNPVPTSKPKKYLIPAILSIFLLCPPLGIVSLFYAVKVDGLWAAGNYAEAQKAASRARIWFWWSFGVGICLIILYAFLSME